MRYMPKAVKYPWREQQGITGLETAIVLIAFVVVSSVFAFAALSTGLFSAEKSKETIQAGLAEARGTIELKGSIDIKATLTTQSTEVVLGASEGATTSHTLDVNPVVPGSETITAVSTTGGTLATLTLGVDYTINYDAGTFTTTEQKEAVTADYTSYTISTADIQVANSAGGAGVDMTPGETVVVYQDVDLLETYGNFGVTRLGNFDADNLLESGEIFKLSINISTGSLTNKDTFTLQVKPPRGAVLLLERTIPDNIDTLMTVE